MATNILTTALLTGAFISLVCAVLYALLTNLKHREALKNQNKRIEELEQYN